MSKIAPPKGHAEQPQMYAAPQVVADPPRSAPPIPPARFLDAPPIPTRGITEKIAAGVRWMNYPKEELPDFQTLQKLPTEKEGVFKQLANGTRACAEWTKKHFEKVMMAAGVGAWAESLLLAEVGRRMIITSFVSHAKDAAGAYVAGEALTTVNSRLSSYVNDPVFLTGAVMNVVATNWLAPLAALAFWAGVGCFAGKFMFRRICDYCERFEAKHAE